MTGGRPRIAIVGAGGVGGYFGAKLARAGESVLMLARGAHLDAIVRHGLHVRSAVDGEFTVKVDAVESFAGQPPVDMALFCVKSFDTRPAAEALRAPTIASIGRSLGTDYFLIADQLTREEQEWTFATVDEDELVDGGTGGIAGADDAIAAIAAASHAFGALFADNHFAASEAFVEGEKSGSVAIAGADDREDSEIFVGDGIEKAPVSGGFVERRSSGIGAEDEAEGAERRQAEQSGKQRAVQVAIHEEPPVQAWQLGKSLQS